MQMRLFTKVFRIMNGLSCAQKNGTTYVETRASGALLPQTMAVASGKTLKKS